MKKQILALPAILLVASCSLTPPPGSTCFVPTFTRRLDDTFPLQMVAVSDGGSCSFTAYRPYGSGNLALVGGTVLTAPPVGRVRVVDVGGKTITEYQAPPGYAGSDSFTVSLGQANVVLPVAVTVKAPATPTPPPPTVVAQAEGSPQAPFVVPIADPLPEPNDAWR